VSGATRRGRVKRRGRNAPGRQSPGLLRARTSVRVDELASAASSQALRCRLKEKWTLSILERWRGAEPHERSPSRAHVPSGTSIGRRPGEKSDSEGEVKVMRGVVRFLRKPGRLDSQVSNHATSGDTARTTSRGERSKPVRSTHGPPPEVVQTLKITPTPRERARRDNPPVEQGPSRRATGMSESGPSTSVGANEDLTARL
jgi:hypothetical protein